MPFWNIPEIAGHRILKSAHKTYLRAVDHKGGNNIVNLAYAAKEAEHWIVETRGTRVSIAVDVFASPSNHNSRTFDARKNQEVPAQVALKSSRGNYLHAFKNGTVNVVSSTHIEHTIKREGVLIKCLFIRRGIDQVSNYFFTDRKLTQVNRPRINRRMISFPSFQIDNDFFEATWKPTQNDDGTWRLQVLLFLSMKK